MTSKEYHERNSRKILKQLKQNGELDAFKHDLEEEKHGKKLFNIKDAYKW